MKILFDHNVDRRFRRYLTGHLVKTTREMKWDRLENGELLRAAAAGSFDVFLSIDKKNEHEQNLEKLPVPIVILDSQSNALPYLIPFAPLAPSNTSAAAKSNALPYLIPFAPSVLSLLSTPLVPVLYVTSADGSVLKLTSPR